MSSIYKKGSQYREQWRTIFLDTLKLSDGCVAGEIGVYDADFGPVFFTLYDPDRYHIIDGAKLNRDDPRLIPHEVEAIDAAEDFAENYFDFLYIDSCTSYLDTLNKLGAWWPKIKVGGWLAGHDFSYGNQTKRKDVGLEVKDAIDDFSTQLLSNQEGKLDTKWIRFQEKKLPELRKGEWRIKKVK
jgi:hypothetical protein